MAPQSQEGRPQRPGAGFKLTKFPKEFEKGFMAGVDSLFLTILSISVVFFTGLFIFLSANAVQFFGYTDDELKERTQKLVQKVYKFEEVEEEVPVEEEKPEEEISEEIQEKRQEDIKKRQENKQENKRESAAEKAARRRAEAQERRAQRDALREKVSNSAQLALITGGADAGGEAVADVLGDANSNIDLDKALQGTDGIAVAQSSDARTRAVEGSRAGGAADINDLVSGVSGVSSTSLGGRRAGIDFGDVSLDEGAAASAGRSKSEVSGKINSIQKAVENCYKKEKRINPGLKGVIEVSFDINKRGQVRSIKFTTNTLNNSSVERCIQTKYRSLRFAGATNDVKGVKVKHIFQ